MRRKSRPADVEALRQREGLLGAVTAMAHTAARSLEQDFYALKLANAAANRGLPKQ